MTATPRGLFVPSPAGRVWSAPWTAGVDPPAPDGLVVAFVGHLAGPVPEIRIESDNPACAVRAAWLSSGLDGVARLNGNFSVAIRDLRDGRVIVARDAAGTKPVFYSPAEPFAFGSSAAEVLRASAQPAVANPRALLRYLQAGTPNGASGSLFEGIHELPGAHCLELRPGRPPEVRRLGSPLAVGSPDADESLGESASRIRALLIDTVRAQAAGAKTGVALSGGLDSSGVAACLREALGPDAPIDAFFFASGLAGALDERPWAECAALRARATLHSVTLDPSSIPGTMRCAIEQQDFPFGSPVVLAHAAVLRAAAERGVRVMLGGHGADLLFGGSTQQIVVRASKLLRTGRVTAAWTLLQGAAGFAGMDARRLFASAVRHALLPRVKKILPQRELWALDSWFRERIAPQDAQSAFDSSDPMRRIVLEHLYHASLPTSLQIEECNAMALGIENRSPYLVAAMLEAASACRDEHLIAAGGSAKHVLREALRELVPDTILGRRARVGFAVPALRWLIELGPWLDSRLEELESLPFFRPGAARGIRDLLARNDSAAWAAAFQAWRWISLLEWARAKGVRFT